MEKISDEQLKKEEEEIRIRDQKRREEKEAYEKKLAEEKAAEEQRKREEEERRIEEEKKRKRQEEEWNRIGTDVIQDLPPVPPSIVDDSMPGAIKGWYLDDEVSKPNLTLHSLKPGRSPDSPDITLKQLRELGIIYFKINLNDFLLVKQIVKERNYKHTDEMRISQTAKDDSFLGRWYQEHFNEDEQIRLIIDGTCFLDFRSKQDKWIRLHATAGDLIVIPPGLYHRGTLDDDDYVEMFRLFRESPRFAPLYRTDSRAERNQARLNYLMALKKGDVAKELGFR